MKLNYNHVDIVVIVDLVSTSCMHTYVCTFDYGSLTSSQCLVSWFESKNAERMASLSHLHPDLPKPLHGLRLKSLAACTEQDAKRTAALATDALVGRVGRPDNLVVRSRNFLKFFHVLVEVATMHSATTRIIVQHVTSRLYRTYVSIGS